MEWIQVFTIIASVLGCIYVFYQLSNERMNRMEDRHIEDMKSFDDKFLQIDQKWERLFERLLIQDKRRKAK